VDSDPGYSVNAVWLVVSILNFVLVVAVLVAVVWLIRWVIRRDRETRRGDRDSEHSATLDSGSSERPPE
jgi:heme/copper-type cytochrome/quinol oxidase subunit 2